MSRVSDETLRGWLLELRAKVADDMTDERIKALRYEAATHGDDAMAAICDRALEGDEDARGQVLDALVDAWAAS